jgi:competence protein ComGC
MNKKNAKKFTIEMLIIGLVLAAVVFIYISNTEDQALAAAAVNARVPLGDVFNSLLNKYF